MCNTQSCSTHVIHLKITTCITDVAQSAKYNLIPHTIGSENVQLGYCIGLEIIQNLSTL